jgi:membrane-associated phospholipid phosphatase
MQHGPRKGPLFFAALLAFALPAWGSAPSVTGQAGLVSMPDARFAPEGSWRTGLSFLRPYQAIWSSMTFFPWIEGSFRFTRIYHVPGFPDNPQFGVDYGDYKDKSFDAKLLLLPEGAWWPALALGHQDVGGGTGVFRAPYAAASKRFGELDLTLGYGGDRIDGAFGGARWSPAALPGWSLVAEYDAFDYPRDHGARLSGAAQYRKEIALGVEYQQEWWGAKAFAAHGELGFNAYVNVPLERREFVPKLDEPPPYTRINPRPTEAQWHADPAHRARLGRALQQQDFRDIELGYAHGRLEAALTSARISSMPRAVGRAARILLSFAPLEVRELRITYRHGALPVATYTFIDTRLLQRYFNGMASREMLAPYVAIEYAGPSGDKAGDAAGDRAAALAAFEEPLPEGLVVGRDGADLVALRGENVAGGVLRVRPGLATYFNDPSGAFKYDLFALASYDRRIARDTFLQAETRLTLLETVSDVTQPSNSVLPHVRTDIAEYKRASRFKLTRLVANRFYQPRERVYARLSAGIYEEMYSGIGGQALYLPGDGRWAADVALDWVRQRDFEGWFGHRDYRTVTGIASLHYRMAQGVTATVRAGRFLARDEGVRGEIKRQFASGVQAGAWYTVTNGKDITSPGSPDSPYYDKGIFLSIPLDTMLTYDTQSVASMTLSPWTRDVGQMVVSPGDLYRILERPLVQMHEHDGLVRFGDRDDDYALPLLGASRPWPDFLVQDAMGFGAAARRVDWLRSAALAGSLVLASAALDDRTDRFAAKRQQREALQKTVDLGDALPIAALGLSGVFAFDDSRPVLHDAGSAALEAGALAFLAAEGLKRVTRRERPTGGERDSFPSQRTSVMWAAVTPYARGFDMPWLYGVAALTNAASVGSRDHWLSDTVAGSVLGYALGQLAWQARREARRNAPKLAVGLQSVALEWELP